MKLINIRANYLNIYINNNNNNNKNKVRNKRESGISKYRTLFSVEMLINQIIYVFIKE
jgi:hypothetical protein